MSVGLAEDEQTAAPPLAPPSALAWALALLPGTIFMTVFVWGCTANPYGPRRFTLFDDAMISMTYGRTLAETGQFVWFPGAERVQGVTNPLWTLYMALIHLIGLEGSAAAFAVTVSGALLILVSSVLVGALVHRTLGPGRGSNQAALLAAATVPFLYPLSYWTLRGMEVGLLATLLLVMMWALPGTAGADDDGGDDGGDDADPDGGGHGASNTVPRTRLGVAGAAAVVGVFTRLDFAPLALAIVVVTASWIDVPSVRRRRVRRLGACIVGASVLVLVFQYVYWGDVLPNTYRLKVDGIPLFDRLERGVVTAGKVAPLLAVCLVCLVALRGRGSAVARRMVGLCTCLLSVTIAYSIWVGGDAWEADILINRYISVAVPTVVVAVMVTLASLLAPAPEPRRRARLTLVATSIVVVAAAAIATGLVANPIDFDTGFAVGMATYVAATLLGVAVVGVAVVRRLGSPRDSAGAGVVSMAFAVAFLIGVTGAYPFLEWQRHGAYLADFDQYESSLGAVVGLATYRDATIGTVWAGAPGYYARRPMLDFLGKSDPTIAASEARGPFLPGHNKWDHEYSIGTLRPNVILQIWASDPNVIYQVGAVWGYHYRCFDLGNGILGGAYFYKGGPGVRWQDLIVCNGIPDG